MLTILDNWAPVYMSELAAQKIPNAQLNKLEGQGHMMLFTNDHWRNILLQLFPQETKK
jgi:hypothetical protein